jgi:hypothetical protein
MLSKTNYAAVEAGSSALGAIRDTRRRRSRAGRSELQSGVSLLATGGERSVTLRHLTCHWSFIQRRPEPVADLRLSMRQQCASSPMSARCSNHHQGLRTPVVRAPFSMLHRRKSASRAVADGRAGGQRRAAALLFVRGSRSVLAVMSAGDRARMAYRIDAFRGKLPPTGVGGGVGANRKGSQWRDI